MNLRSLATRVRTGLGPGRLPKRSSGQMPPIGADFAAQSLNLVQAAPVEGGWRLQAAAAVPYPLPRAELLAAPAELARFVAGALACAPFQGRRVVSALPPSEVRILPLTVHLAQGQSEAQAVAKAAIEQLGVAPGSTVLDYYQVRGADGEGASRQVLVAAAHEPRVLDYLAMLESARLIPVALDIGPAAIARLLAALHGADIGQSTMLLNFGSARSYVTVIWGRRLMLDREIDFGEEQLADAVARALELPRATATSLLREHGIGGRAAEGAHAELRRAIHEVLHPACLALADELAHTQVYVASRTRGSTVSRVYLNGSLARYPGIQARIGELIDVPVHLLDPFAAFAGAGATTGAGANADKDGIGRALALAAGLALRSDANG
jgi:type IV pilus assembly protein PilM